jgi:hypothetical protein
MRKWIAAALVCLPGVASAEMYRYTADNGTVSYTDDLKSVPARYRASAQRIPGGSLESYSRFTRVQSYPELRTWGAPEDTEPATAAVPVPEPRSLLVRMNNGSALEVPLAGEEPVIVRRGRYAWSEDGYLKPHTTVLQGDRVLAEME